MKEVWAVSAGEYSDYQILGLFSTKERAEEFAAKHNEGQARHYSDETARISYGCEARVEERPYAIDEQSPPVPTQWCASFRLGKHERGEVYVSPCDDQKDDTVDRGPSGELRFFFYRKSAEHARRAGQEMLRALRTGAVPEETFDYLPTPTTPRMR